MSTTTPTTNAKRYRWLDLPQDRPMAKLERRRIVGQNVMLSQVFLHEGCSVPMHAHQNEQMAIVVSGKLRFGLRDESGAPQPDVIVQAGEVLHLPANVPHSADALEDTLVIDVFSPPSEKTGIDRT